MGKEIGLLVRFELIWFFFVQVHIEQGWVGLLVIGFWMMYLLKVWLEVVWLLKDDLLVWFGHILEYALVSVFSYLFS